LTATKTFFDLFAGDAVVDAAIGRLAGCSLLLLASYVAECLSAFQVKLDNDISQLELEGSNFCFSGKEVATYRQLTTERISLRAAICAEKDEQPASQPAVLFLLTLLGFVLLLA